MKNHYKKLKGKKSESSKLKGRFLMLFGYEVLDVSKRDTDFAVKVIALI